VAELKDELKKLGLSTNGVKATLAQRLKDALAAPQVRTQPAVLARACLPSDGRLISW
jgi:hypothetical protein